MAMLALAPLVLGDVALLERREQSLEVAVIADERGGERTSKSAPMRNPETLYP
jgi:hypothetical protein